MFKHKKKMSHTIIMFLIPLMIIIGVFVFDDRSYLIMSLIIAFLSMIPLFLTFEQKEKNTRNLVLLAVLVAISVVGRFLFAAVPGFKPVTAIVVLSAIFFGAESGFLVGSLSAILSNMYFGQGPWTPFQMFSWGLIGFIAGLPYVSRQLQTSKFKLILYGIFSGIVFSLLMDIWTVMAMDGRFNFSRYIGVVTLSFPFMVIYAVSNVVFLLLTIKPIGEKLKRIKIKFGIN
jgi:energy-coupling factor transport system substrate-specific component